MDRQMCVRNVARSLSRYNGHSNRAPLRLVLALPLSEHFNGSGSVYDLALINSELPRVKPKAAPRYIDHAIALGLLDRTSPTGEGTTGRVALSPVGRALRAARGLGHIEFEDFLLTCVLLDRDCDMYGLLLRCARKASVTLDNFKTAFKSAFKIREEWVTDLHPLFRRQLAGFVPWIKPDHLGRPSISNNLNDTSLKHHFHLRRAWAEEMGHLAAGGLTESGQRYAGRMPDIDHEFWLAPEPHCIRRLHLPAVDEAAGPSTAWELLSPSVPGSVPDPKVVSAVETFMVRGFNRLRMYLSPQVPIEAVVPFTYYMKHRFGDQASTFRILESVITHGRVDCMLSRSLDKSYYRLPSHSLGSSR